jgi:PhzF family phenazine biosynthesis protein
MAIQPRDNHPRHSLPLYQVDAFTDRPFGGNPAAVIPLDIWLPDETLQAIAVENNLSETAFLVPKRPVDEVPCWHLRWFTPASEVDLCGHATLAAGSVALAGDAGVPACEVVRFETLSGPLEVVHAGTHFRLDLPIRPATPCEPPAGLAAALGAEVLWTGRSGPGLLTARLVDAAAVRALRPDQTALLALDAFAVCVTAAGGGPDPDVDFVSRFFAPKEGIPEDPVTGSAHCTLAPLWSEWLDTDHSLRARQVSARGGEITCTIVGDRVHLLGDAVRVLEGRLQF